jgi:oligopeptide/dipeptide ABC transporter ATP-binding protein
MTQLLSISNLRVIFPSVDETGISPVDGISLGIDRGEMVALVGESGCGKSLTGLAIVGLLPDTATLDDRSSVKFDETELTGLQPAQLRAFRGARIAMVFQDPVSSLNPVMKVGAQITEAIRAHNNVTRRDARSKATELLAEVGIADPSTRVDNYPHQMSGGMRQRVMIAIALAAEPELLIADEPTTALDVTVQAQILELLDELRLARGMAVLLITHDLGIVAGRANRVLVMYAGRIVESAPTGKLFAGPVHPYTRGLFGSLPRIDSSEGRLNPIPGTVPPPDRWPSGCRFHPRCPIAESSCAKSDPELAPVLSDEHRVACPVSLLLVAE